MSEQWGGVLTLQSAGPGPAQNITFSDIVIEDAAAGRPVVMIRAEKDSNATFSDIVFDNIKATTADNRIELDADNEAGKISRVSFDGCVIDEAPLVSSDDD